ncbi:MAG: class I SAM-dependent methyltransferase [Chloroflexota bacterium]
MDRKFEASFVRYLSAKKTVDDRALSPTVWEAVERSLAQRDGSESRPLKILELGSGIGTMVERIVERAMLPADIPAEYTLVDSIEENSVAAYRRLSNFWKGVGAHVEIREGSIFVTVPDASPKTFHFVTEDAFGFMGNPKAQAKYDLLIANAFLDLVNLDAALEAMVPMLRPEGLFYFSINYDGITGFEPTIELKIDQLIETLYNKDMEKKRFNRLPVGGERSGRALLHKMIKADLTILGAGGSDWIVYPQNGSYKADEAYFLRFIIHTIDGALTGHPELDQVAFKDWIEKRQAQIDAGELIYVTHQLDICAQS